MINRRRFLKRSAAGLFIPAFPAIIKAQSFSFADPAFMAQGGATPNGLLQNLSAFWPLNEVAAGNKADLSGNSLTLTDGDSNIAGTTNGSPPSNIGRWADFTVSDASKRLSHASDAKLQAGSAFSMMCWFQPAATVANAALMSKWSGTIFEYVMWTNGDIQLTAHSGNGSNTAVVVGAPGGVQGAPLVNGTTYQIVTGFDGANVWMVVNAGTRQTLAVTGPPLDSLAAPFAIGNYSPSTNIPINGYVGHCAFWKKSLLATDITMLYNSGNPLPFASWTM